MLNANIYSHLSMPSSTHLKNCRPVLSCQENTSGNVTELPLRPKKATPTEVSWQINPFMIPAAQGPIPSQIFHDNCRAEHRQQKGPLLHPSGPILPLPSYMLFVTGLACHCHRGGWTSFLQVSPAPTDM